MNITGKAQSKLRDFLVKLEFLYRSIRTMLHGKFVQITMLVKIGVKLSILQPAPYPISLAQKRVTRKFYYPRKFALFRRKLVF